MTRELGIRGVLTALIVTAALGLFARDRAWADVSLGAWMQHGPDDLTTANVPGLLTLSGNDATATTTMPFSVTIDGTSYSTIAISTNGWIEFGGNSCTSGCGTANSDPVNTALPTSKHSNPFLAVYWDDDQTLSAAGFPGTDIRYGVVGTAPDRTFIVDFQLDVDPTSEGSPGSLGPANDDIRAQVEIHESSQVINVYYDSVGYETCGIHATIGFQAAGGASATAYPLVFNGRILDHGNLSKRQGWSIDLHQSRAVALAALLSQSVTDIGGDPLEPFTTFSGDNAVAGVTLPFAVTIEGTSYSTATIGTNGIVQFGTTTGANPTLPTGLPSASFSGPTLLWYWDDLDATKVQYGTVGTAPNRTFIIDFTEYRAANHFSYVYGQVQIHEGSNLINVRYRGLTPEASGQTGTVGFQGAGGANAAVYPLTLLGKTFDNRRIDSQGWSVHAQSTNDVALHALSAATSEDIGTAYVGTFTTLSGNDAIAGVALPFSVVIDGTSYSSATIGTNGLVQFGTTSGANPTMPSALPSASVSGPTVFWYWDDLQTTDTHIRYGTVGLSPHRTFIIDFAESRVADSSLVYGQVQVHEGSNEINVQYRKGPSASLANGQTATIGFQSAGGASAATYPLTFRGKILDDNPADSGWSVSPLRYCGDGIVQTGAPFEEDCDLGAANGTPGSPCPSGCKVAGCGDGVVQPDPPFNEQCDLGAGNGAAGSCCTPSCAFASSSTACRPAAGECDVAENCTGASSTCPADDKQPNGTACTTDANPCTLDACDGIHDACQHPADNPGVECRPAAGVCDVAETCTGTSTSCPADVKSSGVCRPAAGPCDAAESCNGVSANCPADGKQPSGTACAADANPCTLDRCNGIDDACQHPAGNAGAQCRVAAGVCDVAEACTGTSPTCPADAKSHAVCRPSAGACDPAESCDGVANACPPDALTPAGTTCRAAAGVCDVAETCTGTGPACPTDAKSTAVCRPSAGVCDVAESCDGVANACPADAVTPAGTVCRAAAGVCDVAEACDGAGTACPADALAPASTVCRPATGDCDAAETCTGASIACPADATAPDGTSCDDGSPCTSPDTCESGVCSGSGDPTGCTDHYLCYKGKAGPFTSVPSVHLVDDFEDVTATVVKPRLLCTPASENSGPITDETTHLGAYGFHQTSRHAPHTVTAANPFGTLSLTTTAPALLLVPTNKDFVSTPPAPDLNAISVNHYKCYKIKVTPGTDKFPKGIQATVGDQFTMPAKLFDVRKPRHLCNPVDKNGEGVKNANAHLVCYLVKRAKGEPKHVWRNVFLHDQFGPETMATVGESELCVPSAVTP